MIPIPPKVYFQAKAVSLAEPMDIDDIETIELMAVSMEMGYREAVADCQAKSDESIGRGAAKIP